jgi:uncharacterized protein YndB with AHSA1/START domain
MSDSLTFQQFVKAPPAEVYHALTNSTRLREWMCDLATTDPKVNGRVYFAWYPGFYGAGHFTALEPEKTVAYTWFGRGEITSTQVTFTLSLQEDGTLVTLEHSGLGSGEDWDQIRKNFQHSWQSGFENLASILDTGHDLRLVQRPMLGILINEFNPEIAKKMGLPITEGIRLSGVVDGMGAQAAGLQADDVIVRMGKFETKDVSTLGYFIGAYKAGDQVDVAFYRKGEKKSIQMKLSARPMPEIPSTPQGLAQIVSESYARVRADLSTLFVAASEEAASQKSSPEEWSARETLAHLIHTERAFQTSIQDIVGSYEPIYDEDANLPARIAATLQVFPMTKDLLDELYRLLDETVALVSFIPPEFATRKSSYWRLGYQLTQVSLHINSHMEQIKNALKSTAS